MYCSLLECVLSARLPKADHITKLMLRLATSLVGANVPEVKLDLKERVPLDFDAKLFVSGTNGRTLNAAHSRDIPGIL